ncbi:Exosomal 3'-5' exoribonuclease complex subunit Rrp40 [Phaffia rhodozyma]|uniref:Ribosomal RNA-processing protein 40 n=1 Tax=Phaffia rhodozyma TaxID=264483 RepID=A0A0F7SPJ1_PHARH|nr:Exosomal 3'-5' exoribonuclease complex subunit Rrp40 [Phaffia rhodozyma]
MTSLQILLPGDTLPVASSSISKLGPGTLQTSARFSSTASSSSSTNQLLIATKAGQFGSDKTGKRIYVEGRGKRYVPASQESVIGTVIARHGEGYRVDIGSAHHASLDALAFEGATKRNKPNLKVGSLVYARISLANRDMEPELECFDATTRKSDGFGELKEGMTVTCSLQMSRRLLVPSYPLLRSLSSRVAFECAIGTNAQVWIKAGSIKGAIAVGRAIQEIKA